MEISDEGALNKENISLESESKDLKKNIDKVNDLKMKIENEINEINNLYDKAIDDLTKSFQKKHENLLKEENDIKEKLQNEVTKVKEQLEKFWSEANKKIKLNEKISQGIKKLKKNDKNEINKILAYISNINKNQKGLNKIVKEPIKSLKFNYQEGKSNIEYNEFFLNGIEIPQNKDIINRPKIDIDLDINGPKIGLPNIEIGFNGNWISK